MNALFKRNESMVRGQTLPMLANTAHSFGIDASASVLRIAAKCVHPCSEIDEIQRIMGRTCW